MGRPEQDRPLENLIGRRFGNLIVTAFAFKKNKHFYWEAICDCGKKTVPIRHDSLKGNTTKSCKCLLKELKGPALNPDREKVLKENKYRNIIRRHVNKLNFNKDNILTFEEYSKFIDMPCFYCGKIGEKNKKDYYTNESINTNGIDRLNNRMGYTLQNTVSSCSWCNVAKKDMDVSTFSVWAYRAYNSIFLNKKKFAKCINPLVTIVRPNAKGKIRRQDRDIMLLEQQYKKLKLDARKMKRIFTITLDEYIKLIHQECSYCGLKYSRIVIDGITKIKVKYNSLDRIDSNGQYVIENINTSCVFCNNAKNTKSIDEFKENIKKLYPFASLNVTKKFTNESYIKIIPFL